MEQDEMRYVTDPVLKSIASRKQNNFRCTARILFYSMSLLFSTAAFKDHFIHRTMVTVRVNSLRLFCTQIEKRLWHQIVHHLHLSRCVLLQFSFILSLSFYYASSIFILQVSFNDECERSDVNFEATDRQQQLYQNTVRVERKRRTQLDFSLLWKFFLWLIFIFYLSFVLRVQRVFHIFFPRSKSL